MKRLLKTLQIAAAVLIACGMALLPILGLPHPSRTGAAEERYTCLWEDGTETSEPYFSAYTAYETATEEGIFLCRGGKRGMIGASEEFSRFVHTAEEGRIAELLVLLPAKLRRLEQLAVFRLFSPMLWQSGNDLYAYTGEQFAKTNRRKADEIVLLDGTIAARRLIESEATVLRIGPEATVTAKTLDGTNIERVHAVSPYAADENAVYLDVLSGRRLTCGIPAVTDFGAEYDYADEGALLPCREVRSLDLPFVGNAPVDDGRYFRGELAYLFSTGTEYRVPDTLKSVTVRGGTLIAHAFYRCTSLEEIDASGVEADSIERDAFLGLPSLKLLLSPRADVRLTGEFRSTLLPDGNTLFERTP